MSRRLIATAACSLSSLRCHVPAQARYNGRPARLVVAPLYQLINLLSTACERVKPHGMQALEQACTDRTRASGHIARRSMCGINLGGTACCDCAGPEFWNVQPGVYLLVVVTDMVRVSIRVSIAHVVSNCVSASRVPPSPFIRAGSISAGRWIQPPRVSARRNIVSRVTSSPISAGFDISGTAAASRSMSGDAGTHSSVRRVCSASEAAAYATTRSDLPSIASDYK